MKPSTGRFAALVLFVALCVGAPVLSAELSYKGDDNYKGCKAKDWDDGDCKAAVPDAHGGPILVLTAGVLGIAFLVQRRRKITS